MPSSEHPTFLTPHQVLTIHADQLERYGGRPGIRDQGLLEAALAMPSSGFGGVYVHPTLLDQAAAYLFHITCNHPFIDGNKRTGIVTALVFLAMNDVEIEAPTDALVTMVESVARGELEKLEIAAWFAAHRSP